ncbi:unnamed protein product [Mytilus coruscus]|uniref:Uncharacterized protein n=1 Tax=Mytilus coruscus TaxID=42192 RepID=A0A6J8CM96_MYTCO|nr:unnamed protein product [Mytilus coruscus]
MENAKPELNDICPGLFRMKLNLMYTSGQAQVENRTMALDTAIEREHEIVHGVVDLMRILLDNSLRKHRYIARNTKKLEHNIKNNPKHLNTLADLADLYRSNNLKEKAKLIDDKICKILQSSDPDDITEKAICIVEQGYAVLFEEFKENELEAQQKLADSFELIKAEQNSYIEERKHLLCLALKYTVNARRLLCLAINCKSDDTVAEEKKSSMKMFQKGIQCLRDASYSMEKIYIWTYYYAMACNRMPYSANGISIKAVDLFWSVITNLPKDNGRFSIYRARAYAYIGHKIITRHDVFNASLSKRSLTSDAKFLALLKAPLSAFELAIAELPYDEVILNRKGISLWSMFKFGSVKTDNEKIEYLEQAEKTLSLSISQNPRMHLLAFSTRMKVYMDLSTLNVFSEEKRKDFLHKALHDGKKSIKYNMSPRDVCTVAEVCQKLAKFPNFYRYGPEAVQTANT